MHKMGFIEKIKMRIEEFIQKKRKEKEKKKREREEIRNWQKIHGVKSYSKPAIFLWTCLGLFAGLFETKASSKNASPTKTVFNLKNPKVVPAMQKDGEKLTKIILEVEETVQKIKKEKEVTKVISYQTILKEKQKEVQTIKDKYPDIKKEEKIIPSILSEAVITLATIEKVEEKVEKALQTASEKQKEIVKVMKKKEEQKIKKAKPLKNRKEFRVQTVTKITLPDETKESQKGSLDQTQILSVSTLASAALLAPLVIKEEKKELGKKEKVEVKNILLEMQLKKIEEKIVSTTDPILLQQCIEELEKIKEKGVKEKKEELQKKALQKCEDLKEKAEAKKEELTRKKKTRTEEDLAEILYMETLIYTHLKKQRKELKKFRKKINALEPIQKKLGFIGGIRRMLGRTIQFTFSLFPIAFFRNKKLGLLTSAVLVNNSIRSMRNAVNKVQIPYVEYEKIANTIRKAKIETEETQMLCYDSLEQISYLKEDFMREMGYEMSPEVEAVLKEMNQLEKMIESRTKELEKVTNSLYQAREKNKQKIKKLEQMYK